MSHSSLRRLPALLTALALLLALGSCSREPASASTTLFAMDTLMDLALYGPSEEGCQDALDQAVQLLNTLDRNLDVNEESSELYALNQGAGAPVALSEDTFALLTKALDLCRITEGTLDLTAYPAMKAWGFPSGEYRVPEQAELRELADRIDWSAVKETGDAYTLPAGMELDLGGVAKGWAADRLAELLEEEGIPSAMLNLGQSTLFAPGERPGGGRWRVGIQDPAGETYLAVVELQGHMSTSGGYQRYFEKDGQTYWHILDPATAAPARSGLASVTVLGPSGLICDGMSTALFVMGLDRGAAFLSAHPELGLDAIFIEDTGAITITAGVKPYFTLADGYTDREVTVLP